MDPLRRWTHAAGFTGVCACTTRADTYTCVRCNCRTRQTGYPRGSSTPTPHRDTDSNTERGQGEGEATPLPPLRIVRAGTPRLFCPSFLSIFPPPHAGVTRDPTQRLHAHTLVYRPTHRATMFETAIRISPREVCGVASRTIRRTMHFSTILIPIRAYFPRKEIWIDRKISINIIRWTILNDNVMILDDGIWDSAIAFNLNLVSLFVETKFWPRKNLYFCENYRMNDGLRLI